MIKNLAFKGGGVLGTAYAGAFTVLEELGITKQLQKVAGTSAGAIMATLVALKYSAQEITHIINKTDFKQFLDKKNIFREFTCYGLYAGDAFLQWIEAYIQEKTGKHEATFEDLMIADFLDLHVFACDLDTGDIERFCYDLTPEVKVCEAVRASMSIPGFFEAFKITRGDGHLLVDGGTVFNYPLTAFDEPCDCPNPETLGLYLSDVSKKRPSADIQYDHPGAYLKALFNAALNAQDVSVKNNPEMLKRTIIIDDLGISAENFDIPPDEKIALFNSGERIRTLVQDFLPGW